MIGPLSLNMKAVVNAQHQVEKKEIKSVDKIWKQKTKSYFCNRFAREAIRDEKRRRNGGEKIFKKSLKLTCKREIKKLIFALASTEKRHTKRLKNTQVF